MTLGAIDSLSNHFTRENLIKNVLSNPEELETYQRLGLADNLLGWTAPEFAERMDEVGVDKIIVTALKSWSYFGQKLNYETTVEELVEACHAAPGRVLGLCGINPMSRMNGVRELETAVREHGFVGAHIHPHGYDLTPDHAYYFPYYAKCDELGVPVVISMGHTLDQMPIDVGRPAHLDRIALYFPDLKIVCAHTGWPWVQEAVALASKHANVFMGTSAYAPKYWEPEFVKFINTRGQDKVLWGTDFPVISHQRSLAEIEALDLRDGPKQKLLRDNAQRVFNLS